MVTGKVAAGSLPVFDEDCFTQRIAGLIYHRDIKVARPRPNREVIPASVNANTLGNSAIAVAPLIDIANTHAGHRRTTCAEYLPQNIFTWTEIVMGDTKQAIGPASEHCRWRRQRRCW